MEKRELKFKSWLNCINKMTLPLTIEAWAKCAPFGCEPIWLQYTGLKDKNGVEIYEGDILKILYTDWPSKSSDDIRTLEQYLEDIATIGKVSFVGVSFVLEVYSKKYNEYLHESLFCGEHGFVKVVGNIFQHPELLK